MATMQNTGWNDRIVAFDLLKDSKFGISTMAKVAAESTNPQLRQFLRQNIGQCVEEHFQLADLLIAKGLYQPTNIQAQLQTDLQQAQQVLSQNTQTIQTAQTSQSLS